MTQHWEAIGAAYARTPLYDNPDQAVEDVSRVLELKAANEKERPMQRNAYRYLSEVAFSYGDYVEQVHDMFLRRPTLNPWYGAEILVRAMNDVELRADPDYAEGREDYQEWHRKDTIGHILDPENRDLHYLTLGYDLGTSEGQRAVVLKALCIALELQRPISFVDFGGGQRLVAMKFAEHMEPGHSFAESQVVHRFVHRKPTVKGGSERHIAYHDPAMSDHYNESIHNEPAPLQLGVCIDVQDPDDPVVRSWRMSNQYVDELAIKYKKDEYRRLATCDRDNVRSFVADFSLPIDREYFDSKVKEPKLDAGGNIRIHELRTEIPSVFDFALYFFSIYQTKNATELTESFRNGLRLARRLLVLDAALMQPGTVTFADPRTPFGVTANMWDREHPDLGWQRMMIFKTGRATTIHPQPALLGLPGAARLLGEKNLHRIKPAGFGGHRLEDEHTRLGR